MKLCFLGESHAAQHLSKAAKDKGFELARMIDAELVFVSEDTPIADDGARDLTPIRNLINYACENTEAPIVVSSQVPPGFMRSLKLANLWHMAETLRIKDAAYRAANPEMIIIGGDGDLPEPLHLYTEAFGCPVITGTYEDAEFSKIAINCFLIGQVITTNTLSEAAKKCGADWSIVSHVLKHDKRIGKHAYLEPGSWKASKHLLRDYYTLGKL